MVLTMEPSPKPRRPASDSDDAQPESDAPPTAPLLPRRAAKPAGEATTYPHVQTAPVKGRSGSPHQYEKLGEIARGGMGAILKVQDNDLRRHVAMKVMLGDDRAMRARFIEEAQVTGQLEHPGIVPVHEMGIDHDGRPYFTMKLVKGRSLAQIFRQMRDGDAEAIKEFGLPRLVRILVDVANAIAFAHHKGVLHRDLKPANIMIGRFGEVLVMDWGLAKIAGKRPTASGDAVGDGSGAVRTVDDEPPMDPRTAGDGTTRIVSKHGTQRIARRQTPPGDDFLASSGEASLVTSSRDGGQADTRVGQVAGTPAYMAPEQARGDTARIDRRSDVYALGALLYECLTLGAPVRGKNAKDLIEAAKAGRIDAPEMRAPDRAIPAELSAIALKALHHSQFRRYQWVEDFRRDLELYLDGRSVSAKVDSAWETLRKLMRRNRAASIAIGVLVPLVVVLTTLFLVITTQALHEEKHERRRAEDALEAVTAEQQGRKAAEHAAVPALIAQTRAAISNQDLGQAKEAVDLALHFDPDADEAQLLRAELLVCAQDFPAAVAALEQLKGDRRQLPAVQELTRLCRLGAGAPAGSTALGDDLATVLVELGSPSLAERVAKSAARLDATYRQRLDKTWPGAGAHLVALGKGRYRFESGNLNEAISDLTPLRGLPLAELVLKACPRVQDLAPLIGMPLTTLIIEECPHVADLGPLRQLRLVHLNLRTLPKVADFSMLAGMPLKELALVDCPLLTDIAPVIGKELTALSLVGCTGVASLAPLQGGHLTALEIGRCNQVQDLTPLRGMPLTTLMAPDCRLVSDLAPLTGMRITVLDLDRCSAIASLAPLAGMPVTSLHIAGLAKVRDFTPLAGMPLTKVWMVGCSGFADLAIFRDAPLEGLSIIECPLVRDLSPLAGKPLRLLSFSMGPDLAGLDGLRGLPGSLVINDLPAAEFWRRYDAGKAKTGN